jgi:hypothetical protein
VKPPKKVAPSVKRPNPKFSCSRPLPFPLLSSPTLDTLLRVDTPVATLSTLAMSAPSQNPAAQPEVGASTLAGHPEVTQEKVPAPAAAGPATTEKAAPEAEKKAGRFDKTFVRPLSPESCNLGGLFGQSLTRSQPPLALASKFSRLLPSSLALISPDLYSMSCMHRCTGGGARDQACPRRHEHHSAQGGGLVRQGTCLPSFSGHRRRFLALLEAGS